MPDIDPSTQSFAFVSWVSSNGRRACPLATFGSRDPVTLNARLACADPPRADQPELKNASELRGAIALVVRGGCTFAHKARLLQRAGAVAMVLANNTREEPLAAFTMGESLEDLAEKEADNAQELMLPCVMMCLRDVRELFKKFPPSVKSGALKLEILPLQEAQVVAEECLRIQREQHKAEQAGRGWKAIKSTTSSIFKLLEPQNASDSSSAGENHPPTIDDDAKAAAITDTTPIGAQPPPLAFVQWATSASSYELCFAPLADFCSTAAGTSFTGKLVACDPLLADKPLTNAEQLRDAVVLLKRGSCSFPLKLERVQRAGALAAIVGNDDTKDPDAAFVMSVDTIDAANITLPSVMVSHRIFDKLQTEHAAGTARIWCLSGEAADGLLSSSGKSVSFAELAMPASQNLPEKEDGKAQDLLFDLHVACRRGDHGGCQRILAQIDGEEAKHRLVCASCPVNGLTALHHACAGGNDNVVELLLQNGAVPHVADWAMQTPLHVACAHNNFECARLLLRAESLTTVQVPEALFNADEKYGGLSTMQHIGGGTAMHEAARAGSAKCVELLLAANARVDNTTAQDELASKYVFLGVSAKDFDDSTPLHVACGNAHSDCALYLMAANADINAKDCNGRTPLLLACEAANDHTKESEAVQIIDKLVSSGATMEEEESVENGRLFIDRVESLELRRELELLYLRNAARRAQQKSKTLECENHTVRAQLKCLEGEVDSLRDRVVEHDSHGKQLKQLQLQVNTMLQFLTAQQIKTLPAPTEVIAGTPLLSSGTDTAARSEEELALDAALARDLGKKCLRQSQNALAEKYFQRSLELIPLPGVQHLLQKAQKRCQDTESTTIPVKPPLDVNGVESSSTVLSTNPKGMVIERLKHKVDTAEAAPKARAMLEHEIHKLEGLPEHGSGFELAYRWVEWLVALPWGDLSYDVQNEELYSAKRDAFNRLEELEHAAELLRCDKAARTIQRTFRDRFAVHLNTRATAVTRIQALVRGHIARTYCKEYLQENHARPQPPQLANRHDSNHTAAVSYVDYTASIDAAVYRQLQHGYRTVKLVTGQLFVKQLKLGSYVAKGSTDSNCRVVQLVECVPKTPMIQAKRSTSVTKFSASDAAHLYFVWTRWGKPLDAKHQGSLCGPYEDRQDAERRYNRIVRETGGFVASKTCFTRGNDVGEEGGLNCLRNRVSDGIAVSSVTSA